MGLFQSMQTAVTGISAQSNQLGLVGTNIANVSTTGYKTGSTHFATVLGDTQAGPANYVANEVRTTPQYNVAEQGTLTTTTSTTDLAIDGHGFFMVKGTDGTNVMTRAGAFVQNASGQLVNTGGYTLMGYSGSSTTLTPVTIPTDSTNVTIGTDGKVSATDAQGNVHVVSTIPLAQVTSPQNLTQIDSNVFQVNDQTGSLQLSTAGQGTFGKIDSSTLESSTVDLATELTRMITGQRSYEANSKVLSTTSDMLSKLLSAAV